jgi:hypothetical protein
LSSGELSSNLSIGFGLGMMVQARGRDGWLERTL